MNHNYMFRTIFSFIFATILLISALTALQALPNNANQDISEMEAPSEEGVSLINADETGISLILNTPLIEYSAGDTLFSNGLNATIQEPGAPELPYFSTFIAVPPEAVISIDINQDESTQLSNISVNTVSEPTLSYVNSDPNSLFPATAVTSQPAETSPNPAIYTKDGLYPNQIYQLSEPIYYRDMRLVKLDLYPVQYNPVKQEIQQIQQMQVTIQFEGAQLENLQPAASKNDAYQSSIADMVLNFEQGKAWRSLPLPEQKPGLNSLVETAVSLPLGTESYKIEINEDGIYDILGSDLAAAGLNINSVNPANIQMMSRGEHIAYDFIKVDGNNAILQDNDIIRFYGEGVNGSRREKQFLTHNVYWLWANGNATPIAEVSNEPGTTAVTSFTDSITREDEAYFYSTWTSKWNDWGDDPSSNSWYNFPNEPDSWYWSLFGAGTHKYTIDLPDPVLDAGETTTYTVELTTRDDENYSGVTKSYQVNTCLNSPSICKQSEWSGHKNVNLTQSLPMTTLIAGTNEFTMTLSGSAGIEAYLNRITVDYLRTLKAQDDQLFFTDEAGGRAMIVQDFSTDQLDDILIWDITSPKTPTQILLDPSSDISEHNGRYTYTIGIDSSNTQHYLATTAANILTTNKISKYIAPTNLEPTNGADWIAISHSDFLAQANTLANHRQQSNFGDLSTHVVDIKDIINVYGDGLPMTEAIQAYLRNALSTWPTKPSYVVLVGDGLVAPRNMACQSKCLPDWDVNAKNFVPTDLQFKDGIQGLVPSDTSIVFLFGEEGGENDLIPDMSIGRLTVEKASQAADFVNKIIRYEENLMAKSAGNKRILFLADFQDGSAGGNYCLTNKYNTGAHIPSDYEQVHLCIEDFTPEDPFNPLTFMEAIKTETYEGVSIMNYRGHGSLYYWGSPRFWEATSSISDSDLKATWANDGKPVIIISADCLDGNFGFPGTSVISERFLRIGNLAGSAAHWGSAGLGYDGQHSILLQGFYTGIFEHDQIALGDATNYAKLYHMQNSHNFESELYSFNLQGDPATMAVLPEDQKNYISAMLK